MKNTLILLTAGILIFCTLLSGCDSGTPEPVDLSRTSARTDSKNGLALEILINQTTVWSGDPMSIFVTETNTLSKTNTVQTADDWPFEGLDACPCDTLNRPFWISIFRGYWDASNITSAKPVPMYNRDFHSMCPELLGGITSYEFLPSSSKAVVYQEGASASDPPQRVGTIDMKLEFVSDTALWSNGTKNLSPGIYTVAAGDEWGSIAVLHFTVAGNK